MSEIEFHAGPLDHPVRTILTSEGELCFPDGELEYDQMLSVMGGPKTSLMELHEKWEAYPIPTIILDFDVPESVKRMLLIDMAEHVLPLFERTAGEEQSELARRTIEQCRIVFSNDEDEDSIRKLKSLLATLDIPKGIPKHRSDAESQVYSAIWYAEQRLVAGRVAFTNFTPSCKAAGYGAARWSSDPKWKQSHRAEELWAIAHFVDLMNLLYDAVRDRSSTPYK